jgi:hypothetical protein
MHRGQPDRDLLLCQHVEHALTILILLVHVASQCSVGAHMSALKTAGCQQPDYPTFCSGAPLPLPPPHQTPCMAAMEKFWCVLITTVLSASHSIRLYTRAIAHLLRPFGVDSDRPRAGSNTSRSSSVACLMWCAAATPAEPGPDCHRSIR